MRGAVLAHTLMPIHDTPRPPLLRLLQTWLPAHEALLEMMIWHLPSPAEAQKYRVDVLYEGGSGAWSLCVQEGCGLMWGRSAVAV